MTQWKSWTKHRATCEVSELHRIACGQGLLKFLESKNKHQEDVENHEMVEENQVEDKLTEVDEVEVASRDSAESKEISSVVITDEDEFYGRLKDKQTDDMNQLVNKLKDD